MASQREQIMTALENTLKLTSVKYVTRQITKFDQLPNNIFPAIQIIDDSDAEIEHKTGGYVNIGINIIVNTIVKAEYKNNATMLNNIDAEIIQKINQNLTLGGLCSAIEIHNREHQDIEATYPYVISTRNLIIWYTGNMANGL